MSLILRTARHFDTVLSARFYDTALTYTVLPWAALHNREATFISLLQRGAHVSIQNKNEDMILHHLGTKANAYLVTLAASSTLS